MAEVGETYYMIFDYRKQFSYLMHEIRLSSADYLQFIC